jgi:hypothetical protein
MADLFLPATAADIEERRKVRATHMRPAGSSLVDTLNVVAYDLEAQCLFEESRERDPDWGRSPALRALLLLQDDIRNYRRRER